MKTISTVVSAGVLALCCSSLAKAELAVAPAGASISSSSLQAPVVGTSTLVPGGNSAALMSSLGSAGGHAIEASLIAGTLVAANGMGSSTRSTTRTYRRHHWFPH